MQKVHKNPTLIDLDKSITIILSECERRQAPVSLFVLDGNLLIDSQNGLKFLPLTVSSHRSEVLFDIGVLNFEISGFSGSLLSTNVEKFLFKLCDENKDEPQWCADVCTIDDHIHSVIFPSQNVPDTVAKCSLNWQKKCERVFKDNESITISLHQPGYLKHLGFFVKLAQSDIFGMEDSLQYCKQEWQNRQRFKISDGNYRWLTVPIAHTGSYEPISSKRIAREPRWRRHHWNVLRQRFRKYPYFEEMSSFFKELYNRDWVKLRSLAEAITRHTAIAMGLKHIPIIRTSAFRITPGKKGFAIADFIRSILPREFQPQSNSKRIIYLAGADSAYLEQQDRKGKTYAEAILSAGIDIRYQKVFDNPDLEKYNFTHKTPAMEVLFKVGLYGTRTIIQSITEKISFALEQ